MITATRRDRRPREDGPTALYQLFNADKEMIYVGISHRPFGRWREHAKNKAWWPTVAHRSLVWFDTRAEAILAEQATIESVTPVHNQTTSPQSVPPAPGSVTPRGELYRLCWDYQEAHRALARAVAREQARGTDVARIARSVDWTREYIAKIRKEAEAAKGATE